MQPFKGRFPVGLATFKLPVKPQTFSNARTSNGELALKMEEIAFNVYYPAKTDRKSRIGVDWTPR